MSDNTIPVIPSPDFSVGGSSPGFNANAQYPFFNEITSKDNSIKISEKSPADLSISLTTDSSVSNVLSFYLNPSDVTKAGLHQLKLAKSTQGIVYLHNGMLDILPFPASRAILFWDGTNKPEWVPAPTSGEHAFGSKNGSYGWYEIAECEDACL